MSEPGLDLHEWETRWAELQELAEGAPDEALPEIARAAEKGEVEREDIETALEDLAEIHDYLVEDRAPP